MSPAYSQFVTTAAALVRVLSANLGSAINLLLEGGTSGDAASRRLPLGNLINRVAGIVAVLPFLQPLARETARRLLREKSALRAAELEAADRHFGRLREGRPESLETTSLHLDILSDLKRIHSHICSVAYPVLEAAGELPARESVKGDAAANTLAYQPKLR
jgi:Na+/phosphate symporter